MFNVSSVRRSADSTFYTELPGGATYYRRLRPALHLGCVVFVGTLDRQWGFRFMSLSGAALSVMVVKMRTTSTAEQAYPPMGH